MRSEAMPSWRGLIGDMYWRSAPGVLLVDKSGRRNTYEVYVNGQQIGRAFRLDDAKAMVEAKLGPCRWDRDRTEDQKAVHYYFGPTSEFTDPVIYYMAFPEGRTAAMNPQTLYHFTSPMHIGEILRSGHIDVTESNVDPFVPHAGPDVVWLTSDPDPGKHLWSGGGFKLQFRITMFGSGLGAVHWPEWARKHEIDDRWYEALANSGGDPETWWVTERPVTSLFWIAVEEYQGGRYVPFKR